MIFKKVIGVSPVPHRFRVGGLRIPNFRSASELRMAIFQFRMHSELAVSIFGHDADLKSINSPVPHLKRIPIPHGSVTVPWWFRCRNRKSDIF